MEGFNNMSSKVTWAMFIQDNWFGKGYVHIYMADENHES